MNSGFLNIVLHAHLPYVHHPEHDSFFEEDWLFEAITECYLPLIGVLERLQKDRVDYRLTLSISPTLITMLRESPRPPHPINWEEQDAIFRRLPDHMARMALFSVNTGLRDANMCGLQWSWEVPIPELARSVFVIPAEEFKSQRPHVAVLNDAAWSIVESQRGKHLQWVFSYRGKRIKRMNNTAWKRARRKAGLPSVRVHDLRHTFATRLRAAGVAEEDRCALLGHAVRTMPQLYASADVGRLVGLANRVLDRVGTRTLLRVAIG